MTQLKTKEVATILKKYVSGSDARPILQYAAVKGNCIYATNSHHLIKIDSSIVEPEFFIEEGVTFDPKRNEYIEVVGNYPECDRLIPNHANNELLITLDNIKRSIEVIKYMQYLSGMKKTILDVTTFENELIIRTFDNKNAKQSDFYQTGIITDDEISFSINAEYFKTMFMSLNKVVKKLKQNEITMKFVSNMRPILFETINKEMQVIVLPVRKDGGITKNVVLSENQDVTIPKNTVKSTIKKVIQFISGIVNKRAVKHEEINDFTTYILQEDLKDFETVYSNETDQEYKEQAFNRLSLYVEIEDHLFFACSVGQKDKLKLYTKNDLLTMFKNDFLNNLDKGNGSLGLAQYFGMEKELEEAKQQKEYNSKSENVQPEDYLQHFSSKKENEPVREGKEMKNTIQLIEVGTVDAIPASEVREGDVRLYNYYGTGTVVKIIEKTPKTLTLITEESGEYFMFDIRKTSLVAICKRDQDISMHKPTHAKHRKNGLVDVTEYFPAAEQETALEDATEALERELEAYHLELQVKGMELTESKPEVNEKSTYKVIVSKDRENGLIGEFEKVLTGEELAFQLSMNEVLEIIEEIKPEEATEAYDSQQESEQAKNEHNSEPAGEQPENEVKEDNSDKLIINYNEEKSGVELSFPSKPDPEVLEQLKAAGFRWARYNKVWYKKKPTERDLTLVESLGESEKVYNSTDTSERPSFEYPEIDINDIKNYTVSEELQKREHDAHWIFRQQERDYTKEIQGLFMEYNNEVIEVLNGTDNPSIAYNLKKSLQYFKKHYHQSYVKWLSAKANTPSWAVSGRGNMNISSYNKKMSQIDNHLHKLNEFQSEIDKRIKKAERLIREEEKKRITAEIEKAGMELQFKMVKREWSYMGVTENRKVHTYQDYWIAKSHGCFRIFKGKNELHACKTTESLEHAKKFVAYHIQQYSQKAV